MSGNWNGVEQMDGGKMRSWEKEKVEGKLGRRGVNGTNLKEDSKVSGSEFVWETQYPVGILIW